MTLKELHDRLMGKPGGTTIYRGLLTPNLDPWISECFGTGLHIQSTADQSEGDFVILQGRSEYQGCPELPLELRAWIDTDQNVQMYIRFSLPAGDWRFTNSFPGLPGADAGAYLDLFSFSAAYLAAASCPVTDFFRDIPLSEGLNFYGDMQTGRGLGLLAPLMGEGKEFLMSGVIRTGVFSVPALRPGEYPWSAAVERLPGILLASRLGFDFQVGGIALRDLTLHVYSPLNLDWAFENLTYRTHFAYAGTISIPALRIEMSFCAEFDPDWNGTSIVLDIQGISVDNLAALAAVCGDSDLRAFLPEKLREHTLGQLQLERAALDLVLAGGALSIQGVSVTVGIPGLEWEVWPEHFTVQDIALEFQVPHPFRMPSVSARLYGTVELEHKKLHAFANCCDPFILMVQMGDGETIPFGKFLHLPDAPGRDGLAVDRLRMAVWAGEQYEISLGLASGPQPWVIPIGCTELAVSDITLDAVYRENDGFSGSYAGKIAFGRFAEMDMYYDIPGGFLLHTSIQDARLSELVSLLCGQPMQLPHGFDLEFQDSSIVIEKVDADFRFQLGTVLEGFGLLALEVRKTTGQGWGAAAGLDIVQGAASRLPALGFLKTFENIFCLDCLVLVISSFADIGFAFPDMDKFNDPLLAGGKIQLPGRGGIVSGLNFYGRWTINTSDQKQNLLKEILGIAPQIGITLQVGSAEQACLYVDYQTQIAGHPLSCKFGGKLAGKEFGLFLEGSMEIGIQGHVQTFAVVLDFVTGGALLSASGTGGVPIDFGWFRLGNLAVQAGFNWAGTPSFGITGTISSGSFQSSIAVFFDSADPAKSLVAGSVSDLTLKDVFDTFLHLAAQENLLEVPNDIIGFLDKFGLQGTGYFDMDSALGDTLDNLELSDTADAFREHGVTIPASIEKVFLTVSEKGKTWFLTDLQNRMRHYQLNKVVEAGRSCIRASVQAQLYAAPQTTVIGSLPPFEAGFYINAAIVFFGYRVQATVDIDYQKGFAFEADMDKIVIGSETLFCIKAAQGGGGPHVSASTFDDPHLYINGLVSILGLTTSCFMNANKNGMVFDIRQKFLSVISLDVHGTIGGRDDLAIGGYITVDIGDVDLGPLGVAHISTGVSGELEIAVSETEMYASLRAGFRFAGKNFSLGVLELDVTEESLKNIAGRVLEQVKNFLKALFRDAKEWAVSVAKGFIDGIHDMIPVLVSVFKLTWEEAAKIVQEAFASAMEVCAATQAVICL